MKEHYIFLSRAPFWLLKEFYLEYAKLYIKASPKSNSLVAKIILKMKLAICIFSAALALNGASAFSTGIPTTACLEMRPFHEGQIQTGPAPYNLTVVPIDATRSQGIDNSFYFCFKR
jgi:hypothetical protein